MVAREKVEGTFFRSGRKGSRRGCVSCMTDQHFLRPRSEVCRRPGLRASGARVRVYRKPLAALVPPVWAAHVLSVLRVMAPRLTPAELDWISKQDRAGQSPGEIHVGCARQRARRGVAAPAQGAGRICPTARFFGRGRMPTSRCCLGHNRRPQCPRGRSGRGGMRAQAGDRTGG